MSLILWVMVSRRTEAPTFYFQGHLMAQSGYWNSSHPVCILRSTKEDDFLKVIPYILTYMALVETSSGGPIQLQGSLWHGVLVGKQGTMSRAHS